MGKPFQSELEQLERTYVWSAAVSLPKLVNALARISTYPLIAVGSGGSLTSAHFAATAHRLYTSNFAQALTPLEAVSTPQDLRRAAVILITAGGSNPDILAAFRLLCGREPRRLIVLCASTSSPIATLASKIPWVEMIEFQTPSGRDGFLATNTLLATTVILGGAYANAYDFQSVERPKPNVDLSSSRFEMLDAACRPLWARPNLAVLYGRGSQSAAVDLESKLTEAALAAVQLADFRNFAHGRHHWLAKRGAETGVLAFVTSEDRHHAESLLSLIPADIPTTQIEVHGSGLDASLDALSSVFPIVASAGRARGIDPGDPGVPEFGRKIYHLRTFQTKSKATPEILRSIAIERKSGVSWETVLASGTDELGGRALNEFLERFASVKFKGLVLDYDGTLCHEADRFSSLSPVISKELIRLLDHGLTIGIATGRGKSVKEELRRAVPETHWQQIVVGYYNGGDIGRLSDDTRPDGQEDCDVSLHPLVEVLRTELEVTGLATITVRRPQITIEPTGRLSHQRLWSLVQQRVSPLASSGLSALCSSHSIDVVAPGVSKLRVVREISALLNCDSHRILCIGDKGCWPGNDFELLALPYALSVDEVSTELSTGWNLAMPGERGTEATVRYLKKLVKSKGGFRLKPLMPESG